MAAKSQMTQRAGVASVDPIWAALRMEAEEVARSEPALGGFIFATILSQPRLEDAVCHRLAQRLNHSDVDAGLISQTFDEVMADHPEMGTAFRADLPPSTIVDPACSRYIEPLLYFKGFHALVTYRFAHELLKKGRRDFALYLQSQSSRIFAVDNPAAKIGRASCSITARLSSSVRPPQSAITARRRRASPWAAPARRPATAIPRSATTS
jgi:serine O-acetyltransferase